MFFPKDFPRTSWGSTVSHPLKDVFPAKKKTALQGTVFDAFPKFELALARYADLQDWNFASVEKKVWLKMASLAIPK